MRELLVVDRPGVPARTASDARRRAGACRSRPRRCRRRTAGRNSRSPWRNPFARAAPPTAPNRPRRTDFAARLHGEALVQEQGARDRRRRRREAPRRGLRHAARVAAVARRPPPLRGAASSASMQRDRRAGQQLGVLVEQQRVAPARALQQRRVVLALAAALARSAITSSTAGWRRARPTDPSFDALSRTSTSVAKGTVRLLARDRVQRPLEQLALLGVDDAVGDLDRGGGALHRRQAIRLRSYSADMRVDVVDPPAFTPPYDRALCAALARSSPSPPQVRLVTSRFAYGDVPAADGFVLDERFYRRSAGEPGSRVRRATRLAQHVPDMLRYRAVVSRLTSSTSSG